MTLRPIIVHEISIKSFHTTKNQFSYFLPFDDSRLYVDFPRSICSAVTLMYFPNISMTINHKLVISGSLRYPIENVTCQNTSRTRNLIKQIAPWPTKAGGSVYLAYNTMMMTHIQFHPCGNHQRFSATQVTQQQHHNKTPQLNG